MKDKEPYIQYNGVVGTTYDADSYEEVITDAPDYMYDHIPGGVMMDDGEGGDNPYASKYLTIEALYDDSSIFFNIWYSMGTDYIRSISYSTDNGKTWITTENVDDKEDNLVIEVEVNAGDKVLWKGDAEATGFFDEDEGDYVGSFFASDCQFNAYGNIMSLLYGDDFEDKTELKYDGEFACLFYNYYNDDGAIIINAENLVLPATTLAKCCYLGMFQGCSSLTVAPKLPPHLLQKVVIIVCSVVVHH